MNHGPLIFLGAFFALTLSWFGLVFEPQLQLGNAQPATNMVNSVQLYPQMRPGEARQGLEVYRSLGCAACHSQQIGQTGRTYDVVLSDAGTNRNEVAAVLVGLKTTATTDEAKKFFAAPPRTILKGVTRLIATNAVARLEPAGARAEVKIMPTGPDIARGWGKRRSVAEDFLYDQPVMPGSQRIGPDLADVGSRLPDAKWQLLHLYHPRSLVRDSVMPPYGFLFEKRKIGRAPSPEALKPAGEYAPEAGYEIVPTDKARQLAAYLLSLRADTAIFETPMYVAAVATTNAPGALTNAPPAVTTNSTAK